MPYSILIYQIICETMKNLNKILLLIFLVVFIGCDNHNSISRPVNTGKMILDDEEQAVNFNSAKAEPLQTEDIPRKFIKNGQIDYETENLNKTREDIFKAIKKFDGYISSENEFKSSYEISSNISIRIPAENFDKLIEEITVGVERFDRKEIYVQDVTTEFLDIEARLKTKKELETRYLEILKQANSVTEILEVERQIGELRAEIESFEGRLKYLNNQVSYSTLNVRIYETFTEQTEFGKKFKEGFKNGWNNLILFFVLLVNIWPFILIIIVLIILIRVWRKRRRM